MTTGERLILVRRCHRVEGDTTFFDGLPNGSRLSCGRLARRRNVLCPPGHDTTASFKTRAPVSFKRMLDGALCTDARARRAPLGARARPWDENLTMGSHPTEGRARRGRPVARPWGVGRGAQIPLREHRRSAPRVLTVPKELTKGMFEGRQRAA